MNRNSARNLVQKLGSVAKARAVGFFSTRMAGADKNQDRDPGDGGSLANRIYRFRHDKEVKSVTLTLILLIGFCIVVFALTNILQ